MIRKGTPSGDGRGRGRGGAPSPRGGARGRSGDSPRGAGPRGSQGGPRGSRGASQGGPPRADRRGGREDRDRSYGEGSERSYGERGRSSERSYGERGRPSGGDRSYGERGRSSERSYGERGRPSGGDRSYGERGRASGGDRRGFSGDDRGRSYGDDRRGGFRDDREERGRSYDDRGPRTSSGGDRRGSYRDDRGSYGADRRGPARESRSYGGDRRDGTGGSRSAYSDDRRSFRDDRPAGRDEAGTSSLRAGRGGSRDRYGRDDAVGTIGETAGGSRGRYRRTGGTGGTGRAPARSQAPKAGRGGATTSSRNVFKTARQPLRDEEFYPGDYADERDTTEVPDGVRLQKVLAGAGVASRRTCEEMIGAGRVTVDGQVVRRFGARVDPAKQVIHVDGKRIPSTPSLVYFAINKPIGVVSTMSDPEGRPSLHDFVQDRDERLFHVGRLDTETEGLILLTNDGELAHKLTHPSFGVKKKYWAKIAGNIPRDLGRRLRKGIELEDGVAKADDFSIVQEHGQQALVEIVIHEGRNRIVRRMLEEAGHPVLDLARIEFGPVKLGRLKPGTMRALTVKEVGDLYAAVGM
ncbi:hypothetical protein GCM10009677_12680 [Sphaerisporangium rubeum]|uniref:pseudouridine synthase n=1 Tax=Sphaerisporangium rubeum TaxID=321317 RepID=UPI0031E1E8F1